MFRIDLIRNDEQRPLVTEIPDFEAAFALWQTHNQPCEEWDRLIIVNEEKET